jgi:hypothetical protein
MKVSHSRWGAAAVCAAMALAACAGSQPPTEAAPASPAVRAFHIPAQPYDVSAVRVSAFRRIAAPDAAKRGIYVDSFDGTSIYGFKSGYKQGYGPMCTLFTGQVYINGIAADPSGNLIVPQNNGRWVKIYQGPDMCGTLLGFFKDPYGQPANAATLNAATGTIAIADIVDHGKAEGNLAVCSLATGCTGKLRPKFKGYAIGVALAKNGDCWLTVENAPFTAAGMTYWRGCTGSGKLVSGFKNISYGGLSIDKNSNLVSVDFRGGTTGQLWVYSGCNPHCRLVGGPFQLQGQPFFGALNAKGDTFGTIESEFPYGGTVDIYKYTPTKVAYEYSFDSSFAAVSAPEGFAYSPALNQ